MDINQLNRAYVEQYYIEQYEKDLIMNKKHKHCELIKAWADGAEIEERAVNCDYDNDWYVFDGLWSEDSAFEYRIKPEPKPDVVEELTLYRNLAVPFGTVEMPWANPKHYYPIGNFILIRDGETGELKSAEVLK